MPGTPIAKSHSFSSANCFTWRGVMSCSASALRSSGRRGVCSSGSSSPSRRIVGGRPTFKWRSEPLRRIISWRTTLKLIPADGAGGAAVPTGGAGLAIGVDLVKDLTVFDGLRVLRDDLLDDTCVLGLDLVHDLH